MINYDDVAKENIKDHNPNWSEIPHDHAENLFICYGSRWSKISIFNLKTWKKYFWKPRKSEDIDWIFK